MARNTTTKTAAEFVTIGKHGLKAMVQDGMLLIAIPVDPASLAAAPLSSTGKNRLAGNSGGWLWGAPIPGLPQGVGFNISVAAPAAPLPGTKA